MTTDLSDSPGMVETINSIFSPADKSPMVQVLASWSYALSDEFKTTKPKVLKSVRSTHTSDALSGPLLTAVMVQLIIQDESLVKLTGFLSQTIETATSVKGRTSRISSSLLLVKSSS